MKYICMSASSLHRVSTHSLTLYFYLAEDNRIKFMTELSTSTSSQAFPHVVARKDLFQGVLNLYSKRIETIVNEYPFYVNFDGERAVDMGGVSRDMFTAFFEEAYQKLFDGCTLLTPAVTPGINMSSLSIFGTIMSHAYLVSGVLPVRIAFPTLVQCFLGTHTSIPDSTMLSSFSNSLSVYDAAILKAAFDELASGFTSKTRSGLIAMLSRFGVREIPTAQNFKASLLQIATCEFILKPSAAISMINSGIPSQHLSFWKNIGVQGLFSLYKAKSVSSEKVLEMLDEAQAADSNQERVLTYLRQYVGSMNNDDLGQFLRFVAGSSVCMAKKLELHSIQ